MREGQIELVALVFLAIFIAVSAALTSYVVTYARAERVRLASAEALALAEAGIDEAVYRLNDNAGYTGETGTALGAGTFTVSVTSIDTTTKDVVSTGYVPDSVNPVSTRVVRARLSNDSSVVSFRFGVQIGDGGAIIGNGASIQGNLYSNGNVCDSASCTGPYSGGAGAITGDATVAAGTEPTPNQSWAVQDTGFAIADTSGHASLAQSFIPTESRPLNKLTLYLKKTGSPGDISVAIATDAGGRPATVALATGSLPASSVSGSYSFVTASLTSAPTLTAGTTYWVIVTVPVDAADYFIAGGDSTDGYDDGTALYSSDWSSPSVPWTGAGGDADFEIYLGGVATKLHGITVGGDGWAPTLENCSIGSDAYYQSSFSCTITGGGAEFPGSNPAVPAAMPISTAQIRTWEEAAVAVGTCVPSGDLLIPKASTMTLGPGTSCAVVDGNLTVNGTLYLTGPVWVKGNIVGGVGATIKVDSSIGGVGATLIADVPGSEATTGAIDISNNMILAGNGNPGSYLMILTTNSSASALDSGNNANSVILYVPNGTLEAKNNSSAYQITANRLVLDENVVINYQAGLQSAHFTSGPGGSWVFLPGTYAISP